MEYWKYRISTLRVMNLLFVTILLWFTYIFYSNHHKDMRYVYVILVIGITCLFVVLVISFSKKHLPYYQTLLCWIIWIETVILTDICLIVMFPLTQLVLFVLLLVAIFSVFNRKVFQQFTMGYIVCVVPVITLSKYDNSEKIVFIGIILILMLVTFLKNNYEFNLYKAYETSNKYQFFLLENALEAFALNEIQVNEQGKVTNYRILEINKAFEQLAGLAREKIVNRTVFDVFPYTENYWLEEYSEVVLKGMQKTIVNYSKDFDKWLEVTAYPVSDNQFCVMFVDVTSTLEHERQRADAIKISENAILLKNQFLRDVNHRLRTPLNGMMGMMQLINRDELKGETRELFEAMALEMKHSRNIINQISKYVEIQNKQLEYEKYIVFDLLTKELAELNQDNSMIRCTKDEIITCPFYLEKSILTSVFKELMTNAILHTKNEQIEIVVDLNDKPYQAEEMMLTISVTDFGEGMDEEKLKFIFNEFYHHDFISIYREDDRISLPMCKQLLKSCGGDLCVQSEQGKLTTFSMKLPLFYSEVHPLNIM